nr:hypothetical protein [uncultured archaeon]
MFILAPSFYLFPVIVYTGMSITFAVNSNASVDVYMMESSFPRSKVACPPGIYHKSGSAV